MFFSEWSNFRVEKTTVIHYYGKKYTTPVGFAMALGDSVAANMLDKLAHKNKKKDSNERPTCIFGTRFSATIWNSSTA